MAKANFFLMIASVAALASAALWTASGPVSRVTQGR